MQIILNDTIIDVNILIDTGANASNYISQNLFDRLRFKGVQPSAASGMVRGSLNSKAQRCQVTKAMHFNLSFLPEINTFEALVDISKLNKWKSSKQLVYGITAKLLPPITYDLILGLPSSYKKIKINTINSFYILGRKESIDG